MIAPQAQTEMPPGGKPARPSSVTPVTVHQSNSRSDAWPCFCIVDQATSAHRDNVALRTESL
jgi:hypothetical protein